MNITKLFLMLTLGMSLNSHIVGMNDDNNKKRKNEFINNNNNKQNKPYNDFNKHNPEIFFNVKDNNGNTLLHRMCMENNPSIDLILSLINQKANPNHK